MKVHHKLFSGKVQRGLGEILDPNDSMDPMVEGGRARARSFATPPPPVHLLGIVVRWATSLILRLAQFFLDFSKENVCILHLVELCITHASQLFCRKDYVSVYLTEEA